MYYHSVTVNIARVGSRHVEQVCDRCGFTFGYILARIGRGSGEAPYGVGKDRAEQSATRKAEDELERRLHEEAELVPCPKCDWVSEQQVQGYRRARHGGLKQLAKILGIAGAVVTAIVAAVLAFGQRQWYAAAIALVIGLGVTGSIAVALLLLRKFLLSLIQPNKDHPFPPQLPPGTPEAWVPGPDADVYVPASRPHPTNNPKAIT